MGIQGDGCHERVKWRATKWNGSLGDPGPTRDWQGMTVTVAAVERLAATQLASEEVSA